MTLIYIFQRPGPSSPAVPVPSYSPVATALTPTSRGLNVPSGLSLGLGQQDNNGRSLTPGAVTTPRKQTPAKRLLSLSVTSTTLANRSPAKKQQANEPIRTGPIQNNSAATETMAIQNVSRGISVSFSSTKIAIKMHPTNFLSI